MKASDYDMALIGKLVNARREGRQEGIKEVVAWAEDNLVAFEMTSERVARWRAKLKEWGIE